MAKRGFEQKVADLEELRRTGRTPATLEGLRTELGDRNNYVVSKAAELATSFEAKELLPELSAAYGRFFADPVKTDPQCWAKNALSKALAQLGCDNAAVYLRGLSIGRWSQYGAAPPIPQVHCGRPARWHSRSAVA